VIEETTRTSYDYLGMLREVANLTLMRDTAVYGGALHSGARGKERNDIANLLYQLTRWSEHEHLGTATLCGAELLE
jgi:hypothetical protein